jgi:cell shape-determining protein MreC
MTPDAFWAELAHKKKQLEKFGKLIDTKRKKLSNVNFVERAPEAVVQKERDALAELERQQEATERTVEFLTLHEDGFKELDDLTEDNTKLKNRLATLNCLERYFGDPAPVDFTKLREKTNGRYGM